MPNVDGITTARTSKRPPKGRGRRASNAKKRAQSPRSRNTIRVSPPQRTAQRVPHAGTDTASKQALLVTFVGISLIAVVGLWFFGIRREFSREPGGSEPFFASVIEQLRGVFTSNADDIEALRKELRDMNKTELERLEDRVFPELPNRE